MSRSARTRPLQSGGVQCPSCASLEDRVVDSRQIDEGRTIRRRRECEACGTRFTTFERLAEVQLAVRKRSGTVEPFDREKVAGGVIAAAKARPVTLDAIEDLVTRVEDDLRPLGPEVSSIDVGRLVLAELRDLDEVASLRFASVYKEFADVDDFAREIMLLRPARSD